MSNSQFYLDNIKNNYFEEDNLKRIYDDYLKYLDNKRFLIKMDMNKLDIYFDNDYVKKVEDSLNSLLTIDIDKLYQRRK